MASLELRLPSELIGYSYVNLTIPVADDITPEQAARLHWEYNLRFLLEQNKISNEPVSEPAEQAIAKVAEVLVTEKLPATPVAEEKTEKPELGEILNNPPAPEKKPWENKASVPTGGSLFG